MKTRPHRHLVFLVLSLVLVAARASPQDRGAVEAESDELADGLIASYRSLVDPAATLARIDAKPAFALGHSSPNPRIPPGPFEASWTGLLHFREAGPVTFEAFVCGEVAVEIDGEIVLSGRGQSERARVGGPKAFERSAGFYRLAIRYRSLDSLPARLQIWWQGTGFAREPLPPWLLKHARTEVTDAVRHDQLAQRGRELVGQLGCARCHRAAFPSVDDPPPGPSLADAAGRLNRDWLLRWLEDPSHVRPEARMPALFAADRTGFVERSLVTDYLLNQNSPHPPAQEPTGDHRLGRRQFILLGCAACHFMPDADRPGQPDLGRTPLVGLGDRFPADLLAEFLLSPHARYPDRRMPRVPMTREVARDIAAFLRLWSGSAAPRGPTTTAATRAAATDNDRPPTAEEIDAIGRRLNARRPADVAMAILREKHCADCHVGLGPTSAGDLPIAGRDHSRGCLSGKTLPRFSLDDSSRQAIVAFLEVSASEKHPSPFETRQRIVRHLGCLRCHQRDRDRPPPIELVAGTLGGSGLETVPFQRTPRLHFVHQKYNASHLLSAVREGVAGLRHARYSYRMPAFGDDSVVVLQALAEADGDLLGDVELLPREPADPTIGSLAGSQLVGFQGYACVSCHVWNGQALSDPDPGAVGPDLTRVVGRIRRDWFDRFVENPLRLSPGTPMPSAFPHGRPATIQSVLDGDTARQREAIWSYLALRRSAPPPKPAPPLAVTAPATNEPAIVAQIPLHMPGRAPVESISMLTSDHDLIVYDVGAASVRGLFVGGQILRIAQGRLRTFNAAGRKIGSDWTADLPLRLAGTSDATDAERLVAQFRGYDRLDDGFRIRADSQSASDTIPMTETVRVARHAANWQLVREWRFTNVPAGRAIELNSRVPDDVAPDVQATVGTAKLIRTEDLATVRLLADGNGVAVVRMSVPLPAAEIPPETKWATVVDPGNVDGSLVRPGYRAIAYPRPKTSSGEDLIMPVAIAASPRDGRVFVASTKLGELFTVVDPTDDGREARFENYARGLFQEPYSMLADSDALYVLHRRNLTRITDADSDGFADRFDRVYGTPQSVADAYDYGYGLVREPGGSFVFTLAPHANQHLPGAGNALRLLPTGGEPEVVAYGFRNPIGWCSGPDGETFFTDNQGEWVATNKLCHLAPGRFFGYPNQKQREQSSKPIGRTAIWVPYDWAHSINGVTYDNTGGKFGPFAGQIFMAELMFGGAIIRANLEKVNGEYQGACFPFWGKGLLGPVTMTFDPRGRLWVGSITEPGWMAQPDRGALFRVDFTGPVPFEMQSIHVRSRGFRVQFTTSVDEKTARDPASYQIEHYRYEYTGAYGSPELDRTGVPIERVTVAPDGRSVELTTSPLVRDRVYMITARGVRSPTGDQLAHATGAYTLNEIPSPDE
jgi:mono/diheme cytochrome c family protein